MSLTCYEEIGHVGRVYEDATMMLVTFPQEYYEETASVEFRLYWAHVSILT